MNLAAEEDVTRIEAQLVDPKFFVEHAAEFPKLETELRLARDKVAQFYARWQALEALAKGAESSR